MQVFCFAGERSQYRKSRLVTLSEAKSLVAATGTLCVRSAQNDKSAVLRKGGASHKNQSNHPVYSFQTQSQRFSKKEEEQCSPKRLDRSFSSCSQP